MSGSEILAVLSAIRQLVSMQKSLEHAAAQHPGAQASIRYIESYVQRKMVEILLSYLRSR